MVVEFIAQADSHDAAYQMGRLFGGALCVAVVPLSILVLCIIWAARTKHPTQRILAVVGACVSGLFLVVGGIGLILLAARTAQMKALGAREMAAGQRITMAEFGFEFAAPGDPWVQVDPKKFNPDASFVAMRTRPERFFMVIAEKTEEQIDVSILASVSQANLKSVASESTIVSERSETVNGLPGIRFQTDAAVEGRRFSYVHWCASTPAFAYQLIAWGWRTDKAGLEEEANRLFSSFSELSVDGPAED
ncbi:MAG: hypothetical protein HYY16_17700 [Planctomycetes bacterium]|nr:hypothetical protein [Planctomycetota bacterium]